MTNHVYICGLPGSGNHLFRDYCKHLGWSAAIWHGNKEARGDVNPDARCIIPVRHPGAREQSQSASPADDADGSWTARVLAWASTVPTLLVSYEAVCMDPEGSLRRVAEFLGEEYSPAPFEIYDGTRRRLAEVS